MSSWILVSTERLPELYPPGVYPSHLGLGSRFSKEVRLLSLLFSFLKLVLVLHCLSREPFILTNTFRRRKIFGAGEKQRKYKSFKRSIMNKSIETKIKQQASKSNCRHKHGAVLVFRGSIVSEGHNRKYKPKKGRHAETDTVLGVPKRIVYKSVLYVGRVNSAGKFVESKPCYACRKFLEKTVKGVHYTDHEGKWRKLF